MTTATALHTRQDEPGTAHRVQRYSGFRPEVQGLRAVAVLLVVIYHVFLGRVSGGVDVFLLISAFFMTLSFVRKLEGGRPLAIGRYWLHVFKRLMPMAVLTILATFVLVAVFYPGYEAASWRFQGVTSALYVENWTLAFGAVDYYAADHSTASPFQHFWSLSVQGQVFLLWPLIFGATWLITRRTKLRPVPVLAGFFGAVFLVSLEWSITRTAGHQEMAYFDTRARLWEFVLGSLIALAVPYLRPSRGLRVVLGWAGLLSMIAVGLVIDVQGAFPGWIALWPLLSAAAIIIAGESGSPAGLDRVLSSRPLVRLGDSAYALYLIHWPLLITYLVIRDRPEAGPRSGVLLVLVSVALAIAATAVVEKPLKRWAWPERSKPRLALVIAVCLLLVVVPAVVWRAHDQQRDAHALEHANVDNPGAAALSPDYVPQGDPQAPVLPVVGGAFPEPELGEQCPEDMELQPANRARCHITVPNETPDATLLVVGNSHMHQWIPAIETLAEHNNWRVVSYIRGYCMLATPEEQLAGHDECVPWLDDVDTVMQGADPDLVMVQGTRSTADDRETLPSGMRQRIEDLAGRGRQVIAVRDNPRFDFAPARCAEDHGADAPECAATHTVLTTQSPLRPVADASRRISTVDMGDLICPDGRCTPAIGNVYTYWDGNHLTPDYVRSLAPMFVERVDRALAEAGFPVTG